MHRHEHSVLVSRTQYIVPADGCMHVHGIATTCCTTSMARMRAPTDGVCRQLLPYGVLALAPPPGSGHLVVLVVYSLLLRVRVLLKTLVPYIA